MVAAQANVGEAVSTREADRGSQLLSLLLVQTASSETVTWQIDLFCSKISNFKFPWKCRKEVSDVPDVHPGLRHVRGLRPILG